MKKKIILFCSSLAALILELLPYGAVCIFANPEGDPYRFTYSYFDLTPYGYANFAPFITAILTCVLLVIIIISILLKKDWNKYVFILSAVAAVISLAPQLFGIDYFSAVGALISVCLFAIFILSKAIKS